MKAILINHNGFHKHMYVADKVQAYRTPEVERVSMLPYEQVKDRYVPIREFFFEREYVDEWGEKVLIYEER